MEKVDAKELYQLLANDDQYHLDSPSSKATTLKKRMRSYKREKELCSRFLTLAIETNNLKMVEILLDGGAEINWPNYEIANGFLPIHTACMYNVIDIVKLLVNRGANINLKTRTEERLTPLFISIFKGNTELLELLLKNKAQTKHAFEIAAHTNNLEAAKLLVQYDATPNKESIGIAAADADIEFIEYILEHAEISECRKVPYKKYYEQAINKKRGDMANYLLFISNLYNAIDGTMPFELFAKSYLSTKKKSLRVQKLLRLDTKGDFTNAFQPWLKSKK